MKYRREIDGLRGIAVIPVIFFHAGFGAFNGGFVGVDVFFVISGYLITSIILTEKEQGSFSLASFYERRARRILPALFLVMLVSVPFAWLWLIPSDMVDFSESLVAVSSFSSNIHFWRETGYWGTANELKPLLHTWSLAVEEQYYVLFPLFLMLMWRFRKRWLLGSFLAVAVASLLAADWASLNFPTANFFLLPSRAWELAIGACIAFAFFYWKQEITAWTTRKPFDEVFSLFGLLMIVYAIVAFDEHVPFPSAYALVPTVGTGLIIVFASRLTIVGKLLSSPALVGIGLISYSAYLWHQPVFAFTRHRSMGEPGVAVYVSLAVLSVALAYVSWRFVEKPFRTKGAISRKLLVALSVVMSFLFIGFGLIGKFSGGFEKRFDLPADVSSSFVRSERARRCFDFHEIHKAPEWKCEIGGNFRVGARFFIVGDSHALSVFDAFDAAGKKSNLGGFFSGASGCTPLLTIYALRRDQASRNCYLFNKRVHDFVKSQDIDLLVLVARWTYYTDGGYDGSNLSYIGLSEDDRRNKSVSRAAFKHGLRETIASYKEIGVKVVFVRQVPQQVTDPRRIFYKAYESEDPKQALEKLSVDIDRHNSLQHYVDSLFMGATEFEEKFEYQDVAKSLCDEKCTVGTESKSFYFDDDHLSRSGTKKIQKEVYKLLSEQLLE